MDWNIALGLLLSALTSCFATMLVLCPPRPWREPLKQRHRRLMEGYQPVDDGKPEPTPPSGGSALHGQRKPEQMRFISMKDTDENGASIFWEAKNPHAERNAFIREAIMAMLAAAANQETGANKGATVIVACAVAFWEEYQRATPEGRAFKKPPAGQSWADNITDRREP